MPLLERITNEPLESLISQIVNFQVGIALIWDGAAARALVGIEYKNLGDTRVADIRWVVGKRVKGWRHLLGELEKYLKEHEGCAVIRPICDPRWASFLKERGYKITHYCMEKPL